MISHRGLVGCAEMLETKPANVIGLSFSEVFTRLFGKRAAAYYLAEDRGAHSVFEVETEILIEFTEPQRCRNKYTVK